MRNHTANNNNNQQNPNQNQNQNTGQNTGLIAQALITTEQNVSTPMYTWKLDTCASAHMTSDIGVFEHIQPHKGFVDVGGGGTLLAQDIGSVLLNCVLLDGTSHLSRLNAVLYIPTLGHSLVSWNVLKSKSYVMAGAGDVIVVSLDGNPVLMTKFIRELLFVVQTDIEHSLITTVPNNQPPHLTSNNQSLHLTTVNVSSNQVSNKTQKRPAEQAYSPNKRSNTASAKLLQTLTLTLN